MNALDWLKKNYDDVDWSNLQEDLMESIIEYMEDYASYRQSEDTRQCSHEYGEHNYQAVLCWKCGHIELEY